MSGDGWVRVDPAGETVSLTAHGATYLMEAQPGKITACMRAGRPYEAPLLEHIYREQFGGLAVDAGANFGNHTLWMAAVCGMDVAAFEPIQHHVLARNVTVNVQAGHVRPGQIAVMPVALGAAPGTAAHVAKGTLDPATSGQIEVVTLDSHQLDRVTVIKADVEDMEPAVLAGAADTIARCRPVIFAEAHDGQHPKIAAVLEPWGYRHVASFNARESVSPVERWDPR